MGNAKRLQRILRNTSLHPWLTAVSSGQQQQEEQSQEFHRLRHFTFLSRFLIEPDSRGPYSLLFCTDYSSFCGIVNIILSSDQQKS